MLPITFNTRMSSVELHTYIKVNFMTNVLSTVCFNRKVLKQKTFIKLRFAAYVLAHTNIFEFNLTAAVNDIFYNNSPENCLTPSVSQYFNVTAITTLLKSQMHFTNDTKQNAMPQISGH
jgi:hypothetical protein